MMIQAFFFALLYPIFTSRAKKKDTTVDVLIKFLSP